MVVMRGLDPRIHPLPNKLLSASMDCRVKPGNDELGQVT
ncbi:ABC transporter [Bradyrhizobium sp. U531]